MPKSKTSHKTARRAQQSTAKKPQQTAAQSRRPKATKPATAPKRTPVKVANFDHRFYYDTWCLVTGFIVFIADEHERLHVGFAQNPDTYMRKLQKQVGGKLRITSRVLAPEAALAQMHDELIPCRVERGSRVWYGRTEAALSTEQSAKALVTRWCKMFKRDGRAEDAERRREWLLGAAADVKAHNAFMSNLTKHTKALAALAR